MASFCSPSCDRSLTKQLIQISNSPSKSSFRFANTHQWVDGLDTWSSLTIIEKSNTSQFNGDFHQDIGLYLPRHEKPNSAPIPSKIERVSSKTTTNNLFPERLRQLLKREKSLLVENDTTISSSDDQLSSSEDKPSSKDTSISIPQLTTSNESKSSKVRLPLRQVLSNNSSQEIQSKERDQENLTLLKQHLTSLFTRGSTTTTTVNPKRTIIRIPSVEIKHQNIPQRSLPPSADPSLIMERYTKLRQLLIASPTSHPTINKKFIDYRQSPLIFQGIPSFGLSVTPMEFSSLKNSSLEKIEEQDNNLSTNRPLTQPVPFSCPVHPPNEQLKRHFENGFISSSGDFVLSNQNCIDDQVQNIRKYPRHHRSSSKNILQRSKTLQLLPPVVSGKRLHIPLSTQRHS